jgi:hypothetical protein
MSKIKAKDNWDFSYLVIKTTTNKSIPQFPYHSYIQNLVQCQMKLKKRR